MKKFINKFTILGLGLALVTGCTGNFDDMNTDPNNPTESSPSLIFPKMAQYGYCTRSWEYQIGENLGPNQYAQYVACTTASFVMLQHDACAEMERLLSEVRTIPVRITPSDRPEGRIRLSVL